MIQLLCIGLAAPQVSQASRPTETRASSSIEQSSSPMRRSAAGRKRGSVSGAACGSATCGALRVLAHAVVGEEDVEIARRQRLGEQPALYQVHLEALQVLELARILHALGDGL